MQNQTLVIGKILSNACQSPDKVCMDYDDRTMTYRELGNAIAVVAAALRQKGVKSGDQVGIVLRDFIDFWVATLSAMSVGAVPGGLDVLSKKADRSAVLARYEMQWVIEDSRTNSGLPQSILLPDYSTGESAAPVDLSHSQNDHALLVFSSGTTGEPVASVQTNETLAEMHKNLGGLMQGQDTRLLAMAATSTAAGVVIPITGLQTGGTVFFRPMLNDHRAIADAINTLRISYIFMTPNLVPALIEMAKQQDQKPLFPHLQTLLIASAASTAEMLLDCSEWLSPNTLQAYGSGSVGFVSCLTAEWLKQKPTSVGRVLDSVDVEIVNDNDESLPAGTVGRLRIRSKGAAKKLIGKSKATSDDFRGGWSYPGDLAMLDEDGFLYFAGREGDLINRGGRKIYPIEIEERFLEMDAVRAIAIVGIPHDVEGSVPVAFVESDQPDIHAALETFARAKLAPSQRPTAYVILSELPRNPGGKILKRVLLENYQAGQYQSE